MAVTFLTGFEAQEAKTDGITLTGTAEYSTAQARTGAASIRCNPASGASGWFATGSDTTGTWQHFGLYVASLPTVARRIYGGASRTSLVLNPGGTLTVLCSGTEVGASSTALSTGTQYWIGVRQGSGTSVPYLQINGTTEVSGTGTTSTTNNIYGCNSTEASAIDIYIDDIIVDSAGFLAPSKVNLLVPISDNARATLWTGGDTGTTSLYEAVNNKPPIGTATETDLTQIEHAGVAAGTTDAYDANLATYSTAGVGASDTVLAVQLVAAHGEDISTGAKLLAFSVESNPAVASSGNVTAGDATPTTLGTFPTEWGIHFGTLTTSPSVTLGTSPVMRALRPETVSRVASVCFMGLLVAWTPAVADNQTATPGVVALTTATFAPAVTASDHQSVTPTTAALALATFAPTVTVAAAGITVTPDVASLSLTTFAPSIAVSDNQTVTPGVLALVLSAFAPTVTATDHQSVTPTTAALILSSSEPTVTATAHQTVVPDVASLVLTPFAPTVTGGAGLTVTPDVAALSLASFAPDVLLTDNKLVTPEAASLALTSFAPTVTATGSAAEAEASPHHGGPPLGAATIVGPGRPRYPRRPVRVTPRAARLRLTTFRPSVVVNDDETAIAFLLALV